MAGGVRMDVEVYESALKDSGGGLKNIASTIMDTNDCFFSFFPFLFCEHNNAVSF